MRHWPVSLALGMTLLAACGGGDSEPSLTLRVEAAPPSLRPVETIAHELPELTPEVEAKVTEIRAILEQNSMRRLVLLANAEPAFVSNFAGDDTRTHWDLLRRTGFDPLLKLGELLDGRYATRKVGDQVWYIWPDLAALEADQLRPERLSFQDRARLLELVGPLGVEQAKQGLGYPGVRTAIAEDGTWLYFLHELPTTTDPIPDPDER